MFYVYSFFLRREFRIVKTVKKYSIFVIKAQSKPNYLISNSQIQTLTKLSSKDNIIATYQGAISS